MAQFKDQIVHRFLPSALLDLYRRSEAQVPANLLIQDYIRDGEDWLFNGYCNANSKCLTGFTGRKLRSYPPRFGSATLSRSVTNPALLQQAEALLEAVSYAGIMDIDYRFDKRDGQYNSSTSTRVSALSFDCLRIARETTSRERFIAISQVSPCGDHRRSMGECS